MKRPLHVMATLFLVACSGGGSSVSPAREVTPPSVGDGGVPVGNDPADGGTAASEVRWHVQAASWSLVGASPGQIRDMAEGTDGMVVATDQGLYKAVSGTVVHQNTTFKGWRSAAVIPAMVGSDPWALGLDGSGTIRRLRSDNEVEDVSARFGLRNVAVTRMMPFGTEGLAFVVPDAVVLYDSQGVRRLSKAMDTVKSDGRRIVGLKEKKAYLFDAVLSKSYEVPLEGVLAAAFAKDGRLAVLTERKLYLEGTDGALRPVVTGTEGKLRGLVSMGDHLVFAIGSELAKYDGSKVQRTHGANLPEGAQLLGASSDAVWVLLEGVVTTYRSQGDSDAESFARWESQVRPLQEAVCSRCHGSQAGAISDLSSVERWTAKKGAIYQRVVVKQDMPPATAQPGLSESDRNAIRDWIALP